jgi:TRAP-type mannitol/chloroaromatic compound transport system permease large subunit
MAPKPYQAMQSLPKAAPERTGYTEPKPPTPEPQKSEVPKAYQTTQSLPKAVPERTSYTEPKPPTPEPQKSEVPKAYQTTQSLPKAAPERTGYTEPKPPAPSQKRTTVKIGSQTFRQQITNKLFASKPGASTTKQKAMVVTMPLLFIVLIFMLLKGGVFGTTVRKTEASAEDNVSSIATADLNTKIDWEIPAPYPTTLRDPMRLGPVATTQTGTETRTFVKLIVKGILYTEDNQSAVIGNQIVHEGEEIRGATIVKISKDSVEFEMDGKRWIQKVQR